MQTQQEGSIVVARYKYNRMTPEDFSTDLNKIGVSAGQFARISGAKPDRVLWWLEGKEDIPPYVPVLLALLELPGALVRAKGVVDYYIQDGRQ